MTTGHGRQVSARRTGSVLLALAFVTGAVIGSRAISHEGAFFLAGDVPRYLMNGVFLYDFASSSFFYTAQNFPFPYLYDFSLKAFLYYFPDANNPGRYTQNPRYFFNFSTGQIITK